MDDWAPIDRASLDKLIEEGLAAATPKQRELFARTRVTPTKWQLRPWGDQGGGFWVVAVMADRVIWYNDIEDGFNVSRFIMPGEIPSSEYWCNQSELQWAIPALGGEPQVKLGPPRPVRYNYPAPDTDEPELSCAPQRYSTFPGVPFQKTRRVPFTLLSIATLFVSWTLSNAALFCWTLAATALLLAVRACWNRTGRRTPAPVPLLVVAAILLTFTLPIWGSHRGELPEEVHSHPIWMLRHDH